MIIRGCFAQFPVQSDISIFVQKRRKMTYYPPQNGQNPQGGYTGYTGQVPPAGYTGQTMQPTGYTGQMPPTGYTGQFPPQTGYTGQMPPAARRCRCGRRC